MCLFIWMLSIYYYYLRCDENKYNEVSNCKIPRPPIKVREEQSQPLHTVILNGTIQNGY